LTRFSIITVVKNDVVGVIQTLKSVFAQTWPHYELIVQDGGSTDGTTQALRSFGDKIDSLSIKEDAGIYDAMNQALMKATGDWVQFLNAGDCFENADVLATVADAIAPTDDIFIGQAIQEETGKLHGFRPRDQFWLGSTFDHQATFTRRELAVELAFDTNWKLVADQEFFIRARRRAAQENHQAIPIVRKPFNTGASSGFIDRLSDRLPLLSAEYGAEYPVVERLRAELQDYIATTYKIEISHIYSWSLETMLKRVCNWKM
jgi:glycosyltransferase involved in cell wall biosynthesis